MAHCLAELDRQDDSNSSLESFQQRFPTEASTSRLFKKLMNDLNDKKLKNNGKKVVKKEMGEESVPKVDFSQRFCGHCNTTTDIKEGNFFGTDYIIGGSDDGRFFIWNKHTANIVRILKGDESIVNCLQPHPNSFFLASSGIDSTVKTWTIKNQIVNEDILQFTLYIPWYKQID